MGGLSRVQLKRDLVYMKDRSHAPILGLLAIALPLLLAAAPVGAASRCKALDGDTVQCGPERIRLRAVYAAERGAPGADRERRALQRKLDSGEIRIRRRGKDTYGRTLGDVYVNGRKVTQSDIGPRGGRGADYDKPARGHKPRAATRSPERSNAFR